LQNGAFVINLTYLYYTNFHLIEILLLHKAYWLSLLLRYYFIFTMQPMLVIKETQDMHKVTLYYRQVQVHMFQKFDKIHFV